MVNVLNEELLDELRELMGDDLSLLIDTYRKDTQYRLSAIQEALELSDLNAVIDAAHSLKGSSANVGAIHMEDLCHQIVKAVRDDNQDAVVKLYPELCSEYDRVSGQFSHLLN